jgi:signal transduction histidine kinase
MMAKDRQIELTLNFADGLPLVNINQESIERVIINLLTNAIKYTPVGGKIEINGTHLTDTSEVRIDVKDNGIGIPEDCLEHIFDRFYRVERKVHTIKGTGLGLTIVKKIVEKHKGRIDVSSSIGQGSTFTFWLPVSNPSDNDRDETGEPGAEFVKSVDNQSVA